MTETYAPGWPGLTPRWTSSAKSGVGRALHAGCRIWYTSSHGILDEVYYPRVDQACLRDMELLVTDGRDFFSEEKRDTETAFSYLAPGVMGFRIVNTCRQGRYRIEKDILGDPHRDVLVQRIRFVPLQGVLEDYHVYVLLAPHLGNQGAGNTAFVGDFKGVPMLFAEREVWALALAADVEWGPRSAGFVGASDGFRVLRDHKTLRETWTRAENGNVALCGELLLGGSGGVATLALGFGHTHIEAGHRARWTLLRDHTTIDDLFIKQWQAWQGSLRPLEADARPNDLYRISTGVLATHESSAFPGGVIASLSIPWGQAKGDENLGGYHLVWPRDLVETVGGLLAAGAQENVHRVLHYLEVTQEADGHWPQNMWMDGTPYWSGFQLDESAFPMLLLDLAHREEVLLLPQYARAWPMVLRAAGFLVRNGPVTQEDRWEEDAGYTPFTLAVEVAGLLCAAHLADLQGEHRVAAWLRDTADCWNEQIEEWTYVTDTDLAREHGVEGYYVRIAPADGDGGSPPRGRVLIKNREAGEGEQLASSIVSPDALALVRFGLRAANDPRIVGTVKVIDAMLKTDTPFGPCWRRYNEDGYGEKADGAPFDGTGIGRLWPLLTGERGHYEVAAGRLDEAERMLAAMEAFANEGGMLPEQVWDGPDIPERDLYFGRPAGSAMPLVWAHSEYIKLRRSLQEGRVFDMPEHTVNRYVIGRTPAPVTLWRVDQQPRGAPRGRPLRVQALQPARLRWTADGWITSADVEMDDTGLGLWYVDLQTSETPAGPSPALEFTFFWTASGTWEGSNFSVPVT